jgi:hypothetical protein
MKDFVSLKLCPICGEAPERTSYDLGRPGGHGYPGHTSYQYKCECCGLLKGSDCDDIYGSKETAIRRAKETWNEEVDRTTEFLSRQWVSKAFVEALVENNVI